MSIAVEATPSAVSIKPGTHWESTNEVAKRTTQVSEVVGNVVNFTGDGDGYAKVDEFLKVYRPQ